MPSSRIRFLALLPLALAFTGCGASPDVVLQNEFKVTRPPAVKVIHFHGDTFGMDPSFVWELAPVDEAFVQAIVKNAGLKAADAKSPPASVTTSWPGWWPAKAIESVKEIYHDDSGPLRRVYIDRAGNRILIEFIGT